MLIIQIAIGIVLAFIIIIFSRVILAGIIIPFFKMLDFIDDLFNKSRRKRDYEEKWKRFDEQREKDKIQNAKTAK